MDRLSAEKPPAAAERRQAERTSAALVAEQAALEREQESRYRLVELDRHKSEFISSISHELRTPLTSISGYLELLMDGGAGSLTGPQRQMLGIIDRNSRRLLALLDSLLTLSRLESGTLSVRAERVDVAALISTVSAAAGPLVAARSLTLEITVDPHIGVVPGDSVELERALDNVLTNAVKFTEPGGRISLSARLEPDEVLIVVEDTGVGIPHAEQAKLFTRFFRSGAAQEQAVQGTGLGLVIVKGIIDCHRGAVAVSSTPGEGTKVVVSLPRYPVDAGLPEARTAPAGEDRAVEESVGGAEETFTADPLGADAQSVSGAAAAGLSR